MSVQINSQGKVITYNGDALKPNHITPSGTLTITEYGTYDVSQYSSVTISAPSPSYYLNITDDVSSNWNAYLVNYISLNGDVVAGTGIDFPVNIELHDGDIIEVVGEMYSKGVMKYIINNTEYSDATTLTIDSQDINIDGDTSSLAGWDMSPYTITINFTC